MSSRSNAGSTDCAEAASPPRPAGAPGPHTVPIGDLLTSSFLRRHTCFTSLDDLIAAGERNARRNGHAGITLDGDWNCFIRSVSHYPDWQAMLGDAGAEWLIRRIGLVIDA